MVLFLFHVGAYCNTPLKGRYFIEGDGTLTLANKKSGQRAIIRYRLPDGTYSKVGQDQVDRVFGVPTGAPESISLRFVSLLDYLQDHFQKKGPAGGGAPTITLVSGRGSPSLSCILIHSFTTRQSC